MYVVQALVHLAIGSHLARFDVVHQLGNHGVRSNESRQIEPVAFANVAFGFQLAGLLQSGDERVAQELLDSHSVEHDTAFQCRMSDLSTLVGVGVAGGT